MNSVTFPGSLETFVDLEAFYSADERRRKSGEADYGIYWWDGLQGHSDTWRIAAVAVTGEIFAVLSQALNRHTIPRREPVVLLGTFETSREEYPYEDADRILSGWNLKCGESSSLQWVIDRVVDPAKRGPVSVLCRCQTIGNHVHAVVFVGRVEGQRGRAGELIMREEEWGVFRAALERGFGSALDLVTDAPPELEAS